MRYGIGVRTAAAGGLMLALVLAALAERATARPEEPPPPDRTPVVRIELARPPAPGEPARGEPVVPYARFALLAPWPPVAAEVWIPGIPGVAMLAGTTVLFEPDQALIPGALHPIAVTLRTRSGRQERFLTAVRVSDMNGTTWVDVDLSLPQSVRIYRGRDLVRAMIGSAGIPGAETPLGLYHVQERGEHFYSWKYGYGAYCWVRFLDNYLFHSVPVDRHGRVVEEELRRLGEPASHGCVRLSFADARWLYEHVPTGAPVLIHR